MKMEFEALSQQFNKLFNIRPAAWDEFEIERAKPTSLEDLPHLATRLEALWGTRECQVFLYELLRDNRQGTRQGFPLAIVDEILLLLGVLEAQLGPYRPAEPAVDETIVSPATAATLESLAAFALSVSPFPLEQTFAAPPAEHVQPPEPEPEPAPDPAHSTTLDQLDFELDMADMSQTLHINLDELDENGQPRS
ncbi:MAG: hypothetical protein CGU28_15040 [Candidatus Dactylopiibacterium carminicum]|uniref:Uncharacterized protein n=1 Tax=Candidatus Dactylopiibacterium carminicum TaxID=857335 RepID=A0A272ENK1_9RHOO|nr:hypothetical protein [Candidatus Dactylopiibacterium carminicum]KAF7598034.1 hypothetical protein BGI27_15455 [Candidatus Dactylopiibacterium carminicum]PAS91616.1 MAG: hypothetical protein CGU29_15445 [Candidatus Dactylopiibacterium carminicum]PAS93534.1 MAG: hypothetical protein CGU28_15040 [Candidatus Dactylopiibacterium carminicum]PAS96382.1 MAG: hypothetical protein BSR46_15490 [Candidatus Dactylopiibacterium carminicum]